uniref:Calcium homeostasis endoplasmic reticulum protein n=1 Tax=Syphacia muris TaxID=451379 RepID=A0A158R4S8_9BILA
MDGGRMMMPMPPLINMPHVPLPPQNEDERNMIDQLAEFVAKNGMDFEKRTMDKQYGNPRFAFLFGGEHSEYYRYRLMQEIQNLNEKGTGASMNPSNISGSIQPFDASGNNMIPIGQFDPNAPPPLPIQPQFDANAILTEITSLNQQIVDSEANLRAQYDSIEMQKEAQLATAIEAAEKSKIESICEQVSLDVAPLSKLLDQLSGHCSKEVIASSKKWIFEKCTTDRLREVILMYLLYRVKEPRATEQFKLHILYLINDWAHHCQRKKLDAIRQMLSRYVPQLYAFTAHGASDPSLNEKLEKLVGVWEGHKYFDDGCYKQLRNPLLIYQNWKNAQQAEYAKKAAEIHAQLVATCNGYERQHLEFAMHTRAQINALQQQLELHRMNQTPLMQQLHPPVNSTENVQQQPPQQPSMNRRERRSRFDQKAGPSGQGGNFSHTSGENEYGQDYGDGRIRNKTDSMKPNVDRGPLSQVAFRGGPPVIDDAALIPNCPYYELPAGMMLPLIDMEDVLYKPVPIAKLRLPPPIPPSDRLLHAIEIFYAPPSIEIPRDAEGWERLGLLEYYAKKAEIRKRWENKAKEEGKTLEDLIENVYIEEEEDPDGASRKSSRSRRNSRSSASSSRSRSRSSERARRRKRRKRDKSSSSSGSSSSFSRSRSRSRNNNRSRSRSDSPKRHRRSRSESRSPEARPSFASKKTAERSPSPHFVAPIGPPPRLNSTNKGAQLLAKMGWQGGGLGSEQQGIEEPISGGEVRDKVDQFRGVGSKPDMFEEYRRQMSGYHRNRNRNRID